MKRERESNPVMMLGYVMIVAFSVLGALLLTAVILLCWRAS